ncbi:MAG: FHA domain-containing protein [Verrucomicrobium sp.]|nr:FHA domain-containing protein [Verrucomicrobium sp.]
MPKIFCVSPELHGQIFELSGPRVTVGRAADNAIPIPDPSVSSRHAELVLGDDGDYAIRDLDSTNGTRINGERVQHAALRRGDILRLGNIELRYESEHAPATLPLPPLNPYLSLEGSASRGVPAHFAPPPQVKHPWQDATPWPLLLGGAGGLAALGVGFFLWMALKG